MQNDMRIALEVRLYEDVLFLLHDAYRMAVECEWLSTQDAMHRIIRRLEANAYEVTWKRPNPRKPWYERDPIGEMAEGLNG